MIAGGWVEMERAMKARQSRGRSSLGGARRGTACGNRGATTGPRKTRGCPRGRRRPKKPPKLKCQLLEGLARRLSGIFGKAESSVRHLVHVGAACLDRLRPLFRLFLSLSLPSLGGGGPRGRSVWTAMRHGGMAAWKRAGEGPPDPLGQCSMSPLSSVLAGHLVARLGR